MQPKKVPSVPSVQNVQDPETRRVLQALIDGWNVRNGQTRDDGARFVTRDELEEMTGKAVTNVFAGRGGRDGAGMANGIVGLFQDRVQAIIADIMNSRLWKNLSSRIDRLDGPGGKLERLGLTQTGMAQLIEQTDSKVEVIEGQLVSLDGTIAAVVDTKIAEVTPGFATAQSVTDLQTTIGDASLNAQEALSISQGVDGTIDASWTVKFDADGYVVGAGLGLEGKDGNYTSQFLVRADRFAVGSPTTPALFPFIVDTTTGSPLIAMNGQVYIGARTIQQIADNASVPAINHIGSFATHPNSTGLKKNSTYKNTTDGDTYILLSDGGSWSLWLEKGKDGPAGQGQVKAVAFIRSTAASVAAPAGGSFSSPTPTTAGWSDGVPAGVGPLWQSTRIFTSDGLAPHQAAWTAPQKVANTSAVKYQFSIDNTTWSDTASVDSIYMRTGTSADGGTTWTYSAGVKVKGEQGPQGFQGNSGTRGSVTAYASGSSWNNTTAANAIYSYTGTYYLVPGDTVTISNGSTSAWTKYWAGAGTGWTDPGVVIDGNLLVGGNITARSLNAGDATKGVAIAGNTPINDGRGNTITNCVYVYQNAATMYGLYVKNSYISSTGGGAAYVESYGGFTLDCYNTATPPSVVTQVRAVSGRSNNGVGVFGGSSNVDGVGVYGNNSAGGKAGYFAGNVHIQGNLTISGTYPGGGGSSGVSSFNTRTGAVTLSASDVTTALGATYVQNASYATRADSASSASYATAASHAFAVYSDSNPTITTGSHTCTLQSSDANLIVRTGSTVKWSWMGGTSDANLKTGVVNTSISGCAAINALRVVDYKWRANTGLYDGGKTHVGFIAQEVQAIIPDMVSRVDSTLVLNKSEMIPFLVKAVQELSAEVAAIKAQGGAT